MNTCSVCGSPMKSLLFSTYCPNDCDRTDNRWTRYQDSDWYYFNTILITGDKIPKMATHGWWMYGASTNNYLRNTQLDIALPCPWPLDQEDRIVNGVVDSIAVGYDYLMVFKKVSGQ